VAASWNTSSCDSMGDNMTETPPYLNAHGYITTVLDKVKSAPTPPKFTQDFLHTKLGISSSSARAIIPFLKRIGFLDESATPTDRYKAFRNSSQSGKAAAEGLRKGYGMLYDSNEYVHDLPSNELEGLVLQVTGMEKTNPLVRAITGSFAALKAYAKFDGQDGASEAVEVYRQPTQRTEEYIDTEPLTARKLNIAYTINLNLPETTNVEVFDAIFQSLSRNILKDE